MQEIRENLKLKHVPGQPTPSRREANRVWREEILGIRSEDQRKAEKEKKQRKFKKYQETDSDVS
jgi:hypothetical protein